MGRLILVVRRRTIKTALTDAFESAGFKAGDWGFDRFRPGELISHHVDVIKTPIEGRVAFELKVAWYSAYHSGSPFRVLDLGNSYLSRNGVNWLPPDYPEGNLHYTFDESDLEFLITQGIYFMERWFALTSDLGWLLGLAQYQAGHKSFIPDVVYKFLGFASNKHTKDYAALAFRYAMIGDFPSAIKNLRKFGISDRNPWTIEFERDLEAGKAQLLQPYDFSHDYRRCGGAFIGINPPSHQIQIFEMASNRMVAPNKALHRTSR